jgi:hypothetical protein
MIGTQLQSASNTLDVIVQSGDWERDAQLKQAAMRLSRALDLADQLPELQAAYRATVDAYAAYTAHLSSEVKQL